ncbi:unknown [Prevotella sp. CAG:1124]|nr:unknown [Prevotella sp. CAG:1124]
MASTDVRRTCINILTVNFVGEQVKIVLLYQVAYLVHLPTRIKVSRRVVRITYKDGSRAVVDQLLKLLYLRQGEALFDCRSYCTYLGTGRYGKSHVIGVGRFWHDDFITRIQTRHKGEKYSLTSTACYDYVVGGYIDVVFLIVVDKLRTIAQIPLRRRILENRAVNIPYCVKGNLRSRQVWLTDIQVIDLYSTLLCCSGQRRQFPDRRLWHLKTTD